MSVHSTKELPNTESSYENRAHSGAEAPPVFVGHVFLGSPDVVLTAAFLRSLGVREIFGNSTMAVMELGGGTHIVLKHSEGEPEECSFDLMVHNFEEAYEHYQAIGIEVSEIERGKIHDTFRVRNPAGVRFRVNSSHAGNRVV